MAAFEHHFGRRYPTMEYEQEWERHEGMPLLGTISEEARRAVSATEQFQKLPERNQTLLLDMATMIVDRANTMVGEYEANWKSNFWGLYVVGSRARGEERPDSDLDLLSVGTFYRAQGFAEPSWLRLGDDEAEQGLFRGFDTVTPEELPDEYNVGDTDRKYLTRATPKDDGVLPVDLNVVDLTFIRADLDYFKTKMDVSQDGEPLARVPLVEVSVASSRW